MEDRSIAIEIRNLVRRFGSFTAVDDLSLKVRRGEIFGFLGPNGAGKTTSIRMMCGLLKPCSGEVYINGKVLGKGKSHRRVGICPQHIVLWNKLTCFEQLVFMARMYDLPGAEARYRADMLIDKIGLNDKRNKTAATLSGGMQRRMNVIMALVHDPEIVVFDEPEAGLDPQSRILVRDFIRETAKEKTVIFTTHNMDEADRVSDRVAIIDRGKLLRLDSPAKLKKSIGEGDVLELVLKKIPGNQGEKEGQEDHGERQAIKKLREKGFSIVGQDPELIIKSMDVVSRIPEIYTILESEGLHIKQIQMRENTLEDVFIQLTGRGLRQ